jgi:hypothetical protein
MSSEKKRQPSYLTQIRKLTDEVVHKEAGASEKCHKIKKIVEPIFKKNGSTTLVEYRQTIKDILELLDNGTNTSTEE